MNFVIEHRVLLVCAVLLVWAATLLYRLLVTRYGPADLTGSGIAIGSPKIFDNRSLTLMIEGLNAKLQTFNVVSENVTANLGDYQQRELDQSAARLKLKNTQPAGNEASEEKEQAKASDAPGSNFSPTLGMGAPDALTDQLNLAYQIFNLRILNERALTDRLHDERARMQVVLGFQISIDPPAGTEDCAAVTEIGIDFNGGPVSIVALIPQEKTYNAATLSSRANSIDGSVVSRVMTVGASRERNRTQLYLHRDADTLAFEHDSSKASGAFGIRKPDRRTPPTVFGWQFRPVLGRRSVAPGTRLMLAVISVPWPDIEDESLASTSLNVRVRGYWRSYNRKKQTTNVRWLWWPLANPQGTVPEWTECKPLPLIPSVKIERTLSPKIDKIRWVDAGCGTAVVLIEGSNFFSGTEITIGGNIHSNPENGLILKSEHAIQLRTTVEAFAKGDAVLNGRFGPSIPVVIRPDRLPWPSIRMSSVNFLRTESDYAYLYVVITPVAKDDAVTTADAGDMRFWNELPNLPQPLVYVNDKALDRPYESEPWSSEWPTMTEGDPTSKKDSIRVRAWVPAELLRSGGVVLFKFPFCGNNWCARNVLQPLASFDLEVFRLGSNETTTTLAISRESGFDDKKWLAVLSESQVFDLERVDTKRLLFSAPTKDLANYSKFVLVREGKIGSYLLDIPSSDAAPTTTPPQTAAQASGA